MNLPTLFPAALAVLSLLSAACESTSAGGDGGVSEDGGSSTDGAAPATADWMFRPSPNGFVFENYTNMANPANLTAEEMRRLVGPAACEGGAATGACDLVPQARQWMEAQNQSMNSGHCEGMAVLAAHIFAGALRASDFGADTPFALMLDGNTTLQREIAFWFSTQSTLPQLERKDLTPSALVDVLSADLARGMAFGGTILGLYKRNGSGGHAISPYAVRRPTATTVEIAAYDNNFPNAERIVTIDTAANTWQYHASTNPTEPGSLYEGDAATFTLSLIPVGPRLTLPHPCVFCGNTAMDGGGRGSVQVSLTGRADLSIADGQGHITGHDATGALVSQIPGSATQRSRSADLWQNEVEPTYSVPRDSPLDITLDGQRLTGMEPSEVLITGAGFTLGVEGLQLDPGQKDHIVLQPGLPDITYRASGTETPTLVLAFQQEGADYTIELRSSGVASGQNLRMVLELPGDTLRVSFDGSASASSFELYVQRQSETGTIEFKHSGVTGDAAAVLRVNFGAWVGDGSPLPVDIDDQGDGTFDSTSMLSDEP